MNAGAEKEMRIAARLAPMVHTLLLSKLVLFWRCMTSCMRGCCHCPGVDEPGVDVCGVGVCFGVVLIVGVRLSFGRTVLGAEQGVEGFGEGPRPLELDGDRTRDVVDMMARSRSIFWASSGRFCCAAL